MCGILTRIFTYKNWMELLFLAQSGKSSIHGAFGQLFGAFANNEAFPGICSWASGKADSCCATRLSQNNPGSENLRDSKTRPPIQAMLINSLSVFFIFWTCPFVMQVYCIPIMSFEMCFSKEML